MKSGDDPSADFGKINFATNIIFIQNIDRSKSTASFSGHHSLSESAYIQKVVFVRYFGFVLTPAAFGAMPNTFYKYNTNDLRYRSSVPHLQQIWQEFSSSSHITFSPASEVVDTAPSRIRNSLKL